ncbi:DUF6807 family protein [Bauldia litoralis]|uniref:DUF6807 family protein n=1 Tax=Bauldia litoralis TaxID=665467 RepID=UPI003263C3B9
MTARFVLEEDPIALPRGAWAATERRTLRLDGRPVFSLTQGRYRSYLYPLCTPKGFAVTSEAPADHPHHNSFWIAADHVHCQMPAADDRIEEYTYNFYNDDVFQGRSPGRIVAVRSTGEADGDAAFRIHQSLEWRGPSEWAAPQGRIAATEDRWIRISLDREAYVIDVESTLAAADWDFVIGPTRHSYFNVRLVEGIAATSGGAVTDDAGRSGGAAITGSAARWVDYSGPVGGGNRAGVAVMPDPRDHQDVSWFVTDWGVVTVGPFRKEGRRVAKGQSVTVRYRTIVHDGDTGTADIAARYADYVAGLG